MKNKCVRLLTAAVVLLMVVMALSLSGCGKKNDVENGTAQTDTTTDTDVAENTADTPDDADVANNTDATGDANTTDEMDKPDNKETTQNKEPANEDSGIENSYIVKKGDTLATISKKKYGNTSQVDAICKINGLEDGNLIFVGQKLLLP